MAINSWRSQQVIPIEYVALLLAGIDPLEVDASRVHMSPRYKQPKSFRTNVMAAAFDKELSGANQAKQWYNRIKQALIEGEIHPAGEIRQWNARVGTWRPVGREGLKVYHGFDFDLARSEIARWVISLGLEENELPDFLAGIVAIPEGNQPTEGKDLRALEALGLLAVTFAKGRGQYTHERSGKPNCAQVAEAMSQQARQDGEVYGMSKSKLQRLLSDALIAWEEKRG